MIWSLRVPILRSTSGLRRSTRVMESVSGPVAVARCQRSKSTPGPICSLARSDLTTAGQPAGRANAAVEKTYVPSLSTLVRGGSAIVVVVLFVDVAAAAASAAQAVNARAAV